MFSVKEIKSGVKKYRDKWWRVKKKYVGFLDTLPIDGRAVLIESQHGNAMDGNVFYILKYLSSSEKYKDYNIYLSSRIRNLKSFRSVLSGYGLDRVKLTVFASEEYFRLLATAAVIINDNTFLPFYQKREGQIYLNTWHGTPLKSLGKRINDDYCNIGNAQKNFICSDYLLFPNGHTKDAILKDYMVENLSRGNYVMCGYPRNEAFFDTEDAARIRDALGLADKRVYAYMPTFRGKAKVGGTSKNSVYLNYYLYELDKQLTDDEILFVNLHPVAKKDVDFSGFKHIKKFPDGYETYAFLNSCDSLITDYSSVFFDFACSRKKIILFTYDKEEYLSDRGMYLSLDELPFPQAKDHLSLLDELRRDKEYDDSEFIERFCKYDCADASAKLCDGIILGEDTGLEIKPVPTNGRKNVLIYSGNLAANGITASLLSLLERVDRTKNNYFIAYRMELIGPNHEVLRALPEGVSYIGMTGDNNLSLKDQIIRKLFKHKIIPASLYMKLQKKRVYQGFEKDFGNARIDHAIQFNGYEHEVILKFSSFPGDKTIFVHNDMYKEATVKKNQRLDVLRYAYRNYTNVAIVTEDMRESTLRISEKPENIRVVRNTVNYEKVMRGAELPVEYDSYTEATVSCERLSEILDSDSKKFINIGRFSHEKGQDRLVRQFARYLREVDPECYLIIIGGYVLAKYYEELIESCQELGISDRVVLIKKMSNPHAVLKRCDGFILSSRYEGFGLVLAEADMLAVPVASTDIEGPRLFMNKYGGTLVEDSEQGIYKGICMLGKGEIKPMDVDYAAYNREAVSEFESLIE